MPDSNITKKALAQTMKELMAKQPFSKISVGDICDACGMSRKSFYYHFRDKYDLVNWIFDTEFLQSIRPENYTAGWFWQICVLISTRRRNFTAVRCRSRDRIPFGNIFVKPLRH